MIRVAQIIPALAFGGAERCVVDIVNNSDTNRFSHHIIVFLDNNPLFDEVRNKSEKLELVCKKGKLSLHLLGDVGKKLQELKIDLVHTHLFSPDLWGRLSAKKLGLPVLTTEHNLNYADGWLKNTLKRIQRNQSDHYAACSVSVKNYMIKRYGIEADKIEVVPYGIETSRFATLEPADFTTSTINFLILGRLAKQKGHSVALHALSSLKKYPWRLRIVGQGELESYLKTMVKDLGLSDRVEFADNTHDVAGVLAQSHALLLPSLWEGLGIVAMEAQSAGRLVIGSDADGIPELVKHQETGFLVKPGNAEAWRDRLAWCFDNWVECKKIALAGKQYAWQNYGVDKMVAKYEELYERILKH